MEKRRPIISMAKDFAVRFEIGRVVSNASAAVVAGNMKFAIGHWIRVPGIWYRPVHGQAEHRDEFVLRK
jgi:hypothetical protein